MSKIVRFGVSLDKELLAKFDAHIKHEKYLTRSEALRDLIREKLIKEEWRSGKEVAGAITIVYDHHKRELTGRLTAMQHDHQTLIVSSQHVHLDHDNCLETIIVKGRPARIQELADGLRSAKGVKYGQLNIATTGKGL